MHAGTGRDGAKMGSWQEPRGRRTAAAGLLGPSGDRKGPVLRSDRVALDVTSPPNRVARPGASAALQEDSDRKPYFLLDEPGPIFLVRRGCQPAQLLITDQHIVKQNRQAVRILVVADIARLLVESDPLRDDLVNRPRAGIVEQSPRRRERPPY